MTRPGVQQTMKAPEEDVDTVKPQPRCHTGEATPERNMNLDLFT